MTAVNAILAGQSLRIWGDCYQQQPLLRQYPLLMVLMMPGCIELKLTETEQLALTHAQSVDDLLVAIKLTADPHTLDILRYCYQVAEDDNEESFWLSFSAQTLRDVYWSFYRGIWHSVLITHIPSQITQFVELASLLVNYPLLCKARLMKRQPKGINSYRRMQQLVDRAIPLAQALELTDMDKKLLRCRHVKDFSLLVNRLQKQASSLVLERLATVAMDDLGQVLTHIGPLLNDYEREQVERYWFASCPPLAFANSKTIIQLNSFQALFIDAHQQNHCGVTYWGDMRAGDFALFTVLAPQRAALALSRSASDQAFQIDQLVGRNNCAVSKKTWQVVKGWFKQAFV